MFATLTGKELTGSVVSAVVKAFEDTVAASGKDIVDGLYHTTRNHVARRYPGSTHWNTDRISKGSSSASASEASGYVDVNVAGATRAYHDVTIRPVFAKSLTIPIHAESYGKRASDFPGIFKPKGKNVLAKKESTGGLTFLFALAKKAFQKQDKTLLPTDETFSENIVLRFTKSLQANVDKELGNI